MLLGGFGLGRLARQQVREFRDIVSEDGEDLRAFGKIVPADAVDGVGLRMVSQRVVRIVLDTPESGDAGFIKGNVIAAALGAEGGLEQADFLYASEWIKSAVDGFT